MALVVGAVGDVAAPTLQALASRRVLLDEQAAVQGTLSSLGSLAGILGPALATSLLGCGITDKVPRGNVHQ